MDNFFLNAQRINHHVIASMELDEIKPAKSSRILILIAAVNL